VGLGFLVCEPSNRTTWDTFNILKKEFPSAEITILCRKPIDELCASWFYPETTCVSSTEIETNNYSIKSFYAIPGEDWFVDFLQTLPEINRPLMAIPDPTTLKICRNKKSLYTYLRESGHRAPAVYTPSEVSCLPADTALVLKEPVGSGARGLEFTSARLATCMSAESIGGRFFCECIGHSNRVQGVFFLAQYGRLVSAYSHRRLVTWPPKAGRSVVAESVVAPDLLDFAAQVVQAIGYHGLGMIETLYDDDGNPCLIEINTRIWGSIKLCLCLEPTLLANYVQVCRDAKVDDKIRYTYKRFLWPQQAIFSFKGVLEMLKAPMDRRYLVSGFWIAFPFRSLVFPFRSILFSLTRTVHRWF
jgi:hypothetical protein